MQTFQNLKKRALSFKRKSQTEESPSNKEREAQVAKDNQQRHIMMKDVVRLKNDGLVLQNPQKMQMEKEIKEVINNGFQTERNRPVTSRKPNILSQETRPQVWLNQKNLQLKFMEQENVNLQKQTRDQEAAIKINKDILSQLLEENEDVDDKTRKLLNTLNLENNQLQASAKKLMAQRDQIQADLLIAQQIIEDHTIKEKDLHQTFNEKQKELVDMLQMKESQLQVYEIKIYYYEKYLLKKAITDFESKNLLIRFQDEDYKQENIKVSNVVEDNMRLKREMKLAHQQVNKQKDQLQKMGAKIKELESQLKKNKDLSKYGFNEELEMSIIEQTDISLANIQKEANIESLKSMEKYFPKEYKMRLELLLKDLLSKVKSLSNEKFHLKKDAAFLKENIVSKEFLITKLNSALTKATFRIKLLEEKLGETGYQIYSQQNMDQQSAQIDQISGKANLIDEKDQQMIDQLQNELNVLSNLRVEPQQFGNVSSIIINPHDLSSTSSVNHKDFNNNNYSFSFVHDHN